MQKAEFIAQVADRAGISVRDADAAVDAMLETVTAVLKAGDSISFTGFGKFSTSARAAREGRNPQSGETIQIPAATVPKFSAGAQLKQAVKS